MAEIKGALFVPGILVMHIIYTHLEIKF